MWAVFLAVTKDLWQFVIESLNVRRVNIRQAAAPEFESSHQYSATSPKTLQIRLHLSSYPKQKLLLPLTAEEFLLYRLRFAERDFVETELLERAGYFHEEVRGKAGVKISITPQPLDIMEVFEPTGESKLLFVSDVLEANTIIVESVGLHTPGEYRLDTLTRKDWQEWRPVFIRYTAPV